MVNLSHCMNRATVAQSYCCSAGAQLFLSCCLAFSQLLLSYCSAVIHLLLCPMGATHLSLLDHRCFSRQLNLLSRWIVFVIGPSRPFSLCLCALVFHMEAVGVCVGVKWLMVSVGLCGRRLWHPPLLIRLFVCVCSQEQVYLASQNALWRLSSAPIAIQIKQLMAKREFELALRLAVSHRYRV